MDMLIPFYFDVSGKHEKHVSIMMIINVYIVCLPSLVSVVDGNNKFSVMLTFSLRKYSLDGNIYIFEPNHNYTVKFYRCIASVNHNFSHNMIIFLSYG